jgi:hypothetical protein
MVRVLLVAVTVVLSGAVAVAVAMSVIFPDLTSAAVVV